MPKRKTNPKIEEEVEPKYVYDEKATYEQAKKFLELQEQVKILNAEIAKSKEELRTACTKAGTTGDTGSSYLEVQQPGQTPIILTNSCRTTAVQSVDIVTVIRKELPEHAADLIEKVEVVRDDRLETLLTATKSDGTEVIDKETADKLFVTTESFAFSAKYDKEKKKKT